MLVGKLADNEEDVCQIITSCYTTSSHCTNHKFKLKRSVYDIEEAILLAMKMLEEEVEFFVENEMQSGFSIEKDDKDYFVEFSTSNPFNINEFATVVVGYYLYDEGGKHGIRHAENDPEEALKWFLKEIAAD